MAGTITIITRTLTNADTVDFFHMDQDVRTIASPTFAGLTLSGLTASVPIVTDANKVLTSLAYTGAVSFRKNLGLETDDTPTFAGLTLSGLTASVPIVTDANKALASLAYTGTASFRKNLSLETDDAPTFAGLTLSGLTASVPIVTDANKLLTSLAYTGAVSFRKNLGLEIDDTPTFAGAKLGVSGSRDSDGDSYITVEKTADIDEEQLYLNGVLVRETFISGITSLPKQSGFRATRGTAQSLPTGAETKIQYNTEEYDIQGEYDNVTNFRFTATKAGIYAISASFLTNTVAWDAGELFIIQLYKNGVLAVQGHRDFAQVAQTSAYLASAICDQEYLAVGDYLEIFVYHNQGAAINLYADDTFNFFSVTKIA